MSAILAIKQLEDPRKIKMSLPIPPIFNTPIINILVFFSILCPFGGHAAGGGVGFLCGSLIPLFPFSFCPISGRCSGNSSEFCDLQEVTSLDFCLQPHNGDGSDTWAASQCPRVTSTRFRFVGSGLVGLVRTKLVPVRPQQSRLGHRGGGERPGEEPGHRVS